MAVQALIGAVVCWDLKSLQMSFVFSVCDTDRGMLVRRSKVIKRWQVAAMVDLYKNIKAAQAVVLTPLRGSQFESPRLCRGMVTEKSYL